LGTIELHLSAADRGSAEVGYWLRPQARGHGAATIALRLVSRWACEKLGIERLNLTTAPQNTASQRVADRAGFTKGRRLLAGCATRPVITISTMSDNEPRSSMW